MAKLKSRSPYVIGIFCCLLLFGSYSYAQSSLIRASGTVTDSKSGAPITGATVQQMGGRVNVTQTDANGRFEILASLKGKLKVSMIGYKSAVVDVVSSPLTVLLDTLAANLDDVVVIGYATQKKELLTGSVVNLKFGTAENEIPTTQVSNILAGRAAGVNVGNMNGIPGQSSPSVTIRTASSWNAQPVLYVIDGKISDATDFNNLSPNEIDNVSILKDAASAAVYGSRAAGGVIVVTTKRGKAGKASINYSFNTGVDTRTKGEQLTSAVQAGQLFNIMNGPSAFWSWTQGDFDYFNSHDFGKGKGWGYDMLSYVWRNPFTQTHNLSASGGSDKIKYFVGGSYVKQDGFLKNLTYNKYNIRANITADLTNNFQLFAGITLNNNLTNSTANTYIGDAAGIYRKLLVWQPDEPVWTTGVNAGQPVDYGWIGNMGAEVDGLGGYTKINYLKPVITLSGTYKVPFIKGLTATASFIKSYTDNKQHNFSTNYQMATLATDPVNKHIWHTDSIIGYKTSSSNLGPPYIEQYNTWSEDKQLDLQLNYERTFANAHHIKAWLIYETYNVNGSGVDAWINNFPVYTTDQWWAASTQVSDQYVSNSKDLSTYSNGRRSWIGQLFYDYASKYLATFSYRYDGSANFAPDKRWGFFPSVSAGWVISKENFFKNVKGIDMLKVRASVGLVGNDQVNLVVGNRINQVGSWQWQQSYQSGNSAYFGPGSGVNAGITYGNVINPNLTWEKSLNKNIGIDINFLKNFNASIEYWHTYTHDILGTRIQTTPPTFSQTLPAVNYGKQKAQGFDLTVGYTKNIGKVNFNTTITASYGYAWYTLRDQNVTYDYQNIMIDGRHTNYIAGYKTAGMIRTQSDLTNLLATTPNYKFNGIAPALGQLIYKDVNGQGLNALGKPDGIVDNNDIVVLKKDNNPIVVGWHFEVGYKGFNLSGTFNGYFKQWQNVSGLAGGVEWNRMWQNWATQMWTPTNPNGALPYKYSANDGTNSVTSSLSDFWIKNSSFVRLRNLTLAYTVPKNLYKKYGFDNVHLFVTGTNLFIISKFNKQYYDPEVAPANQGFTDGTGFPIMRSYNAGVSVTF